MFNRNRKEEKCFYNGLVVMVNARFFFSFPLRCFCFNWLKSSIGGKLYYFLFLFFASTFKSTCVFFPLSLFLLVCLFFPRFLSPLSFIHKSLLSVSFFFSLSLFFYIVLLLSFDRPLVIVYFVIHSFIHSFILMCIIFL